MRIVLIDDEENLLIVLADELISRGCEVLTASDPADGLTLISRDFPDVVVTDLRMQSMGGIEVIKHVRELSTEIPVVMLTAYAEIKTAVDAVRAGAADYLTKPVDPDALVLTLKRVVQERRRESENIFLRNEVSSRLGYLTFIGESPEAGEVRDKIERAAASSAPVVVSGEVGVGKELVSRLIHRNSPRCERPFLSVNCRGKSEAFLGEELFGHCSDPHTLVKSKLEIAFGGSIMLDEVTSLPLELQSELAQTIAEGVIQPGGGRRPVKVDVRFFVTTTEDLQEAVSEGRLLTDLLHRVNVVPVSIPRLADRKGDVSALIDYFLSYRCSSDIGKNRSITDSAVQILTQYEWPGNVRELFNTLEGALVLSLSERIKVSDLPADLVQQTRSGQGSGSFIGLRDKLLAEERRLISRALEKNGYIQRRAAKSLGISRSLLNQKIKRLEIRIPDKKE